jgi:hypothetical protein
MVELGQSARSEWDSAAKGGGEGGPGGQIGWTFCLFFPKMPDRMLFVEIGGSQN